MTPHTPRRAAIAALVALASVSLLAACGDDDDDAAGSADTTASTTAATDGAPESTAAAGTGTTGAGAGTSEAAASDLVIDGAWARTSPRMATAGAAYLTITNEGDVDDALVGASVDASVAGTTELHETVVAPAATAMGDGSASESTEMGAMAGDTAMNGDTAMAGDTAMDGMMTMQPIDRLPVPAGDSAVLEPGGYHIMLLDLVEPLAEGESIEITLEFEVAGEVVVSAEVRDDA